MTFFLSFMLDKELSFKEQQLEYYRVEHAYRDAGEEAFARLRAANIDVDSFDLFIRAFKFEEDLEVWAKNKTDSSFSLVTSYKFCSNVGDLGPKRKEGDKQIPEGFYSLSEFNHNSVYFLSLKVDYPNASDSILSDQRSPGGMIFIHGGCRTIGCIPITDRWIKELYVYAVEAKNGG
ncbi:MAG: L,D-transpeptidase family protein, partial [Bacteroidia bacterium]